MEQRLARLRSGQLGPPLLQPGTTGQDGRQPDGDHPLLAALAEHPQRALRQVQVGQVGAAQLAHAHTGGVQQLGRCPVTHGDGVNAALCGDVSEGGARLSLDRPLAAGETVTVGFAPGVTLVGRVAWVDRAECGIEFEPRVAATPNELTVATGPTGFRQGLRVTVMLPDRERKAVLRWTQDNSATVTLQG